MTAHPSTVWGLLHTLFYEAGNSAALSALPSMADQDYPERVGEIAGAVIAGGSAAWPPAEANEKKEAA